MVIDSKFPFFHRKTSLPVDTSQSVPTYFYSIGSSAQSQDCRYAEGQLSAYQRCPALSSIVQRKASAFLNAKVDILNADGKPAQNTSQYRDIRTLMAGRANVLQSWTDFLNELYLQYAIFGEVFILPQKPEGMNAVKGLWLLPPWKMRVAPTYKLYQQVSLDQIVSSYEFTSNYGTASFKPGEIWHLKWGPMNDLEPLRALSKLSQLQDPISNIIAAYEARNVLIVRRGPGGILSNEGTTPAGPMTMKPNEKEELQRDFRRYGLTRDQWQMVITNLPLKFQSLGFPTRDLMLIEEVEDSTRAIADALNYPMHLLGFKAGTTFSNVSEAKKSLYEDAIIPEAQQIYDALSYAMGMTDYKLTADYSHLPVFQESEEQRARVDYQEAQTMEVLLRNGVITVQEWRNMIKEDIE